MDELKRLLVLSGQREKYAPVTEGVILHVRDGGKEIMKLRLEGMMGMRPMVTMLRNNGYDDLEYSDQEHSHQKIGKDMDFGDEDEAEMDHDQPEDPLSAAQEAAGQFAQMELTGDEEVSEDMLEKLTHLTVCLADVCSELSGGEDDDEGSSKYKDFDYEMHPDDKNYPDFDIRLKEGGALKGHPYQKKTDAELKYIQKDAHEAAKAMQGHDSKAEAKYLDQVNDASTILYQRRHKKKTESLEERELHDAEKSKLDALKKKHEGGSMEKSMIDQYGKEKGQSIFYGKLTKMAKEGVEDFSSEEVEEAEELNELSKKTLGSYAKKASQSAAAAVGTAIAHKDKDIQAKNVDKANKRMTGHAQAIDKLTKEAAKGRAKDTKHTGGLSKSINKVEQKALKAKERQRGKRYRDHDEDDLEISDTESARAAAPEPVHDWQTSPWFAPVNAMLRPRPPVDNSPSSDGGDGGDSGDD